MPYELPKAYDPSAIEPKWAEFWVREKLFALPTPESGQNVFTLLLPPPNVTGRLHMGHMLNQTEMDILIRWNRMRGKKTLWLPGTDHAGIATQMMVERQLEEEGKKRVELGREKFVERVWEWKKHYGGAIQSQMKRLGASVDWEREYFTMDEDLSRAVREAFVRLHEKGKIYRGKYIVNWCPRCVTAISDLEVVHEETTGKLYEIRYPLLDGSGYITVATTRPETMLGDTAVAVNPKDERYTKLVGKKVRLPLMDREIPVVADDWANPEFGTGAVKVTPAHDPNDFALGKRHALPEITILDEHAHIINTGGKYDGLDRFAARKKVLMDLQSEGLLGAVKDHAMSIGKCDRCKTVVEPRLSEQWFVKVEGDIAQRAIEAVKRGHIQITPENYKTIYLNWMGNIYDWCISRQLWWGHRIPAWHCQNEACKHINVAREAPAKCSKCGGAKLEQDTDVLDTWFSSGLLPFTVFGWPEKTKDLDVFYPTTLLVTGFDILFFWVARMIMLGCWFMGDEDQIDLADPAHDEKLKQSIPFENVYIHALVRDADRQKMSKTKGNVIDPIEITEKFGTDAVRFTLASQAAPGTDIAFNEDRTQGYRAFANKIWNAARFIFMNVEKAQQDGWWQIAEWKQTGEFPTTHEDHWISFRFEEVSFQVKDKLEQYRFDEASAAIYDFFWKDFCDWYIELIKPRLGSPDLQVQKSALFTLMSVFEGSLRLLAPFMPFLTEELFHAIYEGKPPKGSIALASFPDRYSSVPLPASQVEAVNRLQMLQSFAAKLRASRIEQQVPAKDRISLKMLAADRPYTVLTDYASALRQLSGCHVESFTLVTARSELSRVDGIVPVQAYFSKDGSEHIGHDPLLGNVNVIEFEILHDKQKPDPAAERDRLTKELAKLEKEFASNQRQLGNEQFLAKAPANVVEGLRRRESELKVLLEKTKSALAALK